MSSRWFLIHYPYAMNEIVNSVTIAAVDAIFDDYFQQGRSPGLIYAIAQGDQILHWKAMGDAILDEAPTQRITPFRVASITKSFTAMAILQLRDQGLLDLDKSFLTYIPELFAQQIEVFEITVRQLLTMSAGFPTDDSWADRVESFTDDEFNQALDLGFRFNSRPGARFEYSNLGYALLGRIIANISKKSYVNYVTTEIIQMIGLTSTTFDFESAPNLAKGYAKFDTWIEEPHQHSGAFSPIGGVITTIDDLVLWSAYLSSAFDPDALEMGPLKKSSRREMQKIHQIIIKSTANESENEASVEGYGFGLVVEHPDQFGRIISHSGGYPGFGAHMQWHADSGICIVAFANGRYSSPVKAVIPALQLLIKEVQHRNSEISAELTVIHARIHELLLAWNDSTADQLFAVNMDLDYPREYRKNQIAKVGALTGVFKIIESLSSSHLRWREEAELGTLEIEIRLAPLRPTQVQTLNITCTE